VKIAIAALATAWLLTACSDGASLPKEPRAAKIVHISPRPGRFHTDEVIITAKSDDGRLVGMHFAKISGLKCQVGQEVSATTDGNTLDWDNRICTG
jgi:hypothetical protein